MHLLGFQGGIMALSPIQNVSPQKQAATHRPDTIQAEAGKNALEIQAKRDEAVMNAPKAVQDRTVEGVASNIKDDFQARLESRIEYLVLREFLQAKGEKGALETLAEAIDDNNEDANPDTISGRPAVFAHAAQSLESGERFTLTMSSTRIELETADIELADGLRVALRRVNIEHVEITVSGQAMEEAVMQADPLALDLDGDGQISTTGVDDGKHFDLDADGKTDKASFVEGGDAFLAYDENDNGRIDSGHELFGDQRGHANGFEALGAHDENKDGKIDTDDTIFDKLRLFRMDNDGRQTLLGLAEAGVMSINVDYNETSQMLNRHDEITQTGAFTRTNGEKGLAADILLGYRRASNA